MIQWTEWKATPTTTLGDELDTKEVWREGCTTVLTALLAALTATTAAPPPTPKEWVAQRRADKLRANRRASGRRTPLLPAWSQSHSLARFCARQSLRRPLAPPTRSLVAARRHPLLLELATRPHAHDLGAVYLLRASSPTKPPNTASACLRAALASVLSSSHLANAAGITAPSFFKCVNSGFTSSVHIQNNATRLSVSRLPTHQEPPHTL